MLGSLKKFCIAASLVLGADVVAAAATVYLGSYGAG